MSKDNVGKEVMYEAMEKQARLWYTLGEEGKDFDEAWKIMREYIEENVSFLEAVELIRKMPRKRRK